MNYALCEGLSLVCPEPSNVHSASPLKAYALQYQGEENRRTQHVCTTAVFATGYTERENCNTDRQHHASWLGKTGTRAGGATLGDIRNASTQEGDERYGESLVWTLPSS